MLGRDTSDQHLEEHDSLAPRATTAFLYRLGDVPRRRLALTDQQGLGENRPDRGALISERRADAAGLFNISLGDVAEEIGVDVIDAGAFAGLGHRSLLPDPC